MISSIIQIGNNVDICLAQQIEQEKLTGVRPHIYRSKVSDLYANDEMELEMPTEGGKLVVLPLGIRFEFVFYSLTGLYRGMGLIKERYKSDNRYMLRITLKSQLRKYQRREYYRMPCVIPIAFYEVTLDQINNLSPERYQMLVELPEIGMTRKTASIVDISGGGVRFVTSELIAKDAYIMIELTLNNGYKEAEYLLPSHILSSDMKKEHRDVFENRAEFLLRDRKIREEIIRYIFDEERKNRRKENKEEMNMNDTGTA